MLQFKEVSKLVELLAATLAQMDRVAGLYRHLDRLEEGISIEHRPAFREAGLTPRGGTNMEQLTRKERLVLGLIPVGYKQAIHKRRLAELTGLDEREAREIIYRLVVEHGLPIGSSTEPGAGGYFIIKSVDDMDVATRHLKPRAVKIFKRTRALEKIAQTMFDRQFKLVLDK